MDVSRAMLTYQHQQPLKDAPVRTVIAEVVAKHPSWGNRLVFGWIRDQGHDYSECTVHRVYRQSGYAAQWCYAHTCRMARSQTIRLLPTVCLREVWISRMASNKACS